MAGSHASSRQPAVRRHPRALRYRTRLGLRRCLGRTLRIRSSLGSEVATRPLWPEPSRSEARSAKTTAAVSSSSSASCYDSEPVQVSRRKRMSSVPATDRDSLTVVVDDHSGITKPGVHYTIASAMCWSPCRRRSDQHIAGLTPWAWARARGAEVCGSNRQRLWLLDRRPVLVGRVPPHGWNQHFERESGARRDEFLQWITG